MDLSEEKYPLFEMDTPEFKKYGDLFSIMLELDSVMKICRFLIKNVDNNKVDPLIKESMWTTAVIKYSRCFKSGKRFGLKKDVFSGLLGEPYKTHKFFMDMRDKHIAHSVNPYEQVNVGLFVDEKKKKIIGVGCLHGRLIISSKDGVTQLGMLAKHIIIKLKERFEEIGKELEVFNSSIPVEEILKRPRQNFVVACPDQANVPRGN